LNEYSARGLRLIEVDKADLVDLPDIDVVSGLPENSSSSAMT
jgi:predicted AAA+ superfamily ATPase